MTENTDVLNSKADNHNKNSKGGVVGCDVFREDLKSNIDYLQHGNGRLISESLGEAGQWHLSQINGFLKSVNMPDITKEIYNLYLVHEKEEQERSESNSAEKNIKHRVQLAGLEYGGSINVELAENDGYQYTLIKTYQLSKQIKVIQNEAILKLSHNPSDLDLIRSSMIFDGLKESLKSLMQCLLCYLFPDCFNKKMFGHLQVHNDSVCIFDSIYICPQGKSTWDPVGVPISNQNMYGSSQ